MKSPFQKAIIVGENISFAIYSQQPVDESVMAKKAAEAAVKNRPESPEWIHVKRGDPRFVMSRGELMSLIACPQKWIDQPADDDSTASTRYGSLVDTLALQPDQFDDLYCVAPETYTNDKGEEKPWNMNANFCKDWVAKRSDKQMVKQKDLDAAEDAIKRLWADGKIRDFINCSKKQVMVSADYHDAETGLIVPVRVLTDLVPDPKHILYGKSMGDLKTSQDASNHKWPRTVSQFTYHVQGALNLDLHTAASPDIERIEFRHLIQESEPPYQTGRRILSSEFIEIGRSKYMAALKLYCQCLKHQFWPDFETGPNVMNGWSLTQPSGWDITQALDEASFEFPKHNIDLKNLNPDVIP